MSLILGREDLRNEYRDINCSQTRFEYFTKGAQKMIVLFGCALFREYDGRNYNVIYPPKKG